MNSDAHRACFQGGNVNSRASSALWQSLRFSIGRESEAARPFGMPSDEPAAEPDLAPAPKPARHGNVYSKNQEAHGNHPEAEDWKETEESPQNQGEAQDDSDHRMPGKREPSPGEFDTAHRR